MISLRIGLVSTVLTLGLTACGQSIAPFEGFNSGSAHQDYHKIFLNASAAGLDTYDRNGRLVAVAGPMVNRDDMLIENRPIEVIANNAKPVELAARLEKLPIPVFRPQVSDKMAYGVVSETKPATAALTEPTLAAIRTAGLVKKDPVPLPRLAPAIDELLVPETQATVIPSAAVSVAALEPVVTPVAYQPSTQERDATAGLALLNPVSLAETAKAVLPAPSSPSGGLDDLTTTVPDDAAGPQAGAPETGLESDILSMTDEEVDILLVQLEDDSKSGLERVRNMTPEEKARLRHQYEKRSFLGHFAKMDRGNDGALTREEMLAYFTIMHAAFDADYDNVVTRAEAPTLLLRIKLLGRGFPAEGLTLEELAARLDETFVFLDRNKNGKLGWPELL